MVQRTLLRTYPFLRVALAWQIAGHYHLTVYGVRVEVFTLSRIWYQPLINLLMSHQEGTRGSVFLRRRVRLRWRLHIRVQPNREEMTIVQLGNGVPRHRSPRYDLDRLLRVVRRNKVPLNLLALNQASQEKVPVQTLFDLHTFLLVELDPRDSQDRIPLVL